MTASERLRRALRETAIPVDAEAERRGLAVVAEAYAQRQASRRSPLPRLAVAFAVATLLAALLLSPAGAAVREWVDDVFTAAAPPPPEPGLREIPGGGRLLVHSAAGPWVVRADGSRRLLGDYDEATWSPRGLYVAAAEDDTLTALEPDGTPRWSLSAAAPVRDPRWSPSGLQIAYRAAPGLRVVDGDGSDDRLLDPAVEPVAAAWSPDGLPRLAYARRGGKLRIVNTESGEAVDSAHTLPGIARLEWAAGGVLAEASAAELRLRQVTRRKLSDDAVIGAPRRVPLPKAATIVDLALAPNGSRAAIILSFRLPGVGAQMRSEVFLLDIRHASRRRLISVPGRLSSVTWAPRSDRLLVSWPEADQWLFLPTRRGKGRAVAEVSSIFAPGGRGDAFSRPEGWCCPATVGGESAQGG